MIDWFKYYKKKYLRSKRGMIFILYDARQNPFCKEEVIVKLCEWLDRRTENHLNKATKNANGMWDLKPYKVPKGSSYEKFLEFERSVNNE